MSQGITRRFFVLAAVLASAGCEPEAVPSRRYEYVIQALDPGEGDEDVPLTDTLELTIGMTQIIPAAEMRTRLGVGAEAKFERSGPEYVAAFLAESGARTLEPLSGQPLRVLDIARTPISDLSPVSEMPLESVSLVGCPVKDLSPLAHSPLVSLDLSETLVTDLSPLKKMSHLRELYLEKTEVTDLSPLGNLDLDKLWLADSSVSSLKPLAGRSFVELNLCKTRITSLEDLSTSTLQTLWLRNTAVRDLTPLASRKLVSLDLQDTPVADLSPLREMQSLERLNLAGTEVTDLTPLAPLPLVRLIFSPERITQGIDVIREMKSLRQIDVSFDGTAPAKTPSEFWELYDAGKFKPETPAPR